MFSYKYLFYKYFQLFKISGEIFDGHTRSAVWKTNLALSLLLLMNVTSLLKLASFFSLIEKFEFSKDFGYLHSLSLVLIFYFFHHVYLAKDEKYIAIAKKYEDETRNQMITGRFMALFYFIITLLLIFFLPTIG